MDIGFKVIREIREVEEIAITLGLKLVPPNYSYDNDLISLIPTNNSYPTFSRDTVIFTGNLAEVKSFMRGFEFARRYDYLLNLKFDKIRNRREQDLRNEQMLELLKKDIDK